MRARKLLTQLLDVEIEGAQAADGDRHALPVVLQRHAMRGRRVLRLLQLQYQGLCVGSVALIGLCGMRLLQKHMCADVRGVETHGNIANV